MHIPDNYLSPETCAVLGAAMVPVWAVAVKKVKAEVTREKLPALGVGAAFSFLVMMLNIPLPGGTTGHAVGGVLLAILMGPWAASISVTIALLVQALLFGDGGLLSFGANCFNMAFALPFAGYFVYKLVRGWFPGKAGELAGAAVGAYVGLNLGALLTAIEFGLQPLLFRDASGLPLYCPYPLAVSVPAMMLPHLLVAGFAEAAFTVAVFAFIRRVSPGIIHEGAGRKLKPLTILVAALIVLSPLGLLAAGTAWGEWGADEIQNVVSGGSALGFTPQGMVVGFQFNAPLPDYAIAGLPEAAGYVLSAVAGAAILVILFKLLSLMKKNGNAGASPSKP